MNANTDKLASLKKDRVMSIAIGEGLKYGTLFGSAVGVSTFLASKISPLFNKSMSISAKTSLPVVSTYIVKSFSSFEN